MIRVSLISFICLTSCVVAQDKKIHIIWPTKVIVKGNHVEVEYEMPVADYSTVTFFGPPAEEFIVLRKGQMPNPHSPQQARWRFKNYLSAPCKINCIFTDMEYLGYEKLQCKVVTESVDQRIKNME